ncbi:peptidase M16 [Minwuia thermotolerans]|uniref:Peptidase M16 n=1 Tax=Minwuia thermotolerans TaxID=2056226 RepID=A0A2M9FXE6_9PROT|nr:peptidase M16 [Minwuia thermotolerans]
MTGRRSLDDDGGPYVRPLIAGLAAAMVLTLFAPRADAGLFDPQTFTLDNGMEVVVVPDHRAPVVVHMVWYRVGAADEPKGKSGIAHFLEHLMFKGTEKIPPGEFSRIVAANGGRDNAFTSQDYTAYFQVVAKDRLPLMMEMEADRMVNLRLDAESVATERQVILEERRQRTDATPQGQFGEQVQATFYLSHPYSEPIIGWEEEIGSLTREDALAFYEQFYAPNNAILVVAGDITAEELKPLAEKHYGVLPANEALERPTLPHEPPHRAARRITDSDPRVAEPSWQRQYIADSANWGEPDNVIALQVLGDILGGGSTSRLYRALVVEQGIAASAGAWYSGVNRGPGAFGLYATPARGADIEDLERAVDAEIRRVIEDGVTQEELDRARTVLLAEAVYMRDSLSQGARVFGSSLVAGLTVEDVESWPDRLRAVTVDDVVRAARANFRPEASVTAILSPENPS